MPASCRRCFLPPCRYPMRGRPIRPLLIRLMLSLQCTSHALLASPTTSLTRIPERGLRREAPSFLTPRATRDGIYSRDSAASSLSKTTLSLFAPDAIATPAAISLSGDALKPLAEALGYLVAVGSISLYTPIAVRMLRSKSAEGLTASTWWLKLTGYTCTDVYNIKKGFPISSFIELLVITIEAVVVLGLVTYYQKRIDGTTFALVCVYLAVTGWALLSPTDVLPWGPPDGWIGLAQISSPVLNAAALLPQLKQNWDRRSSGDYSPVSALFAATLCAARLFTTVELAGGDPLILLNFGVALLMNLAVLCQVIYFGTRVEGRSLESLFLADVKSPAGEEGSRMGEETPDKLPKTIEAPV